jgi:hypothetical protein
MHSSHSVGLQIDNGWWGIGRHGTRQTKVYEPRGRVKAPKAGKRGQKGASATGEGLGADAIDPRVARILRGFAGDPAVTYWGGKGFGSAALKVNGKIFAFVSSQGKLVAKLPAERVDELIRLGKGERFDPGHGRLMKEWFATETSSLWGKLAREAYVFVSKSGR